MSLTGLSFPGISPGPALTFLHPAPLSLGAPVPSALEQQEPLRADSQGAAPARPPGGLNSCRSLDVASSTVSPESFCLVSFPNTHRKLRTSGRRTAVVPHSRQDRQVGNGVFTSTAHAPANTNIKLFSDDLVFN